MIQTAAERAHELMEQIRVCCGELAELAEATSDPRELLDVTQTSARARNHADAMHTRVVDVVDARAAHTDDGLQSLRSWLAHNTQVARAHARRQVNRARILRDMPIISERFHAGRLSADQVDAIANIFNPRTADVLRALDGPLADLAESTTVQQLSADLRTIAEAADTNGSEPDPGHADRGLHLSQGFDGRFLGRLTLSSTDGAKLSAILDQVAERYRRDDMRKGVSRTAAQRRVDALMDLVTSRVNFDVTIDLVLPADQIPGFDPNDLVDRTGTADDDPPHGTTAPTGSVPAHGPTGDSSPWQPLAWPSEAPSGCGPRARPDLPSDGVSARWRARIGLSGIGYGARVLHSQQRVSEAATLALAARARFRAVVVDPTTGSVLYYGHKRRLASAAQHEALKIESGGTCCVPGCSRPARFTDAHHVTPYRFTSPAGPTGPTDLDNLLALCGSDHDLAHARGWDIAKRPGHPAAGPGGAVVTRPDGTVIDPRPGWNQPRTAPQRPPRGDRR